jgi:hypothetical protein
MESPTNPLGKGTWIVAIRPLILVTKYSCELFVRVNFLADGIVVDDALDSASVSAGEQAVLTFASLKAANYEGSKKIKFTEATCY